MSWFKKKWLGEDGVDPDRLAIEEIKWEKPPEPARVDLFNGSSHGVEDRLAVTCVGYPLQFAGYCLEPEPIKTTAKVEDVWEDDPYALLHK